ncbi:MAG: HAMP domain-containing sensor histidine kinase [Bacteroidia bacterium]|nr:HAMP domain-containing sensor histidine kinase [Bacteroidia bacterium]
MDKRLIPAHVLFAKWFIRIRWIAIAVLAISAYVVKNLSGVSIQDTPIYILTLILLIVNTIHFLLLHRIIRSDSERIVVLIKQEIRFQIIADFIILTLMLHYSGGIENPLMVFFFFHMIIASSIFPPLESYLHTTFALILAAIMVFLECYGIIPHYHIEGFIDQDLYCNQFYIFGTGFIFCATSFLLVSLIHLILTRSIKIGESYVRSNIALEKKDKLQHQYVLRVTHDIKGHLAAIISTLSVVRTKITGTLNESQEEFINRAYDRTELLTGFVKDLLNLTQKRLRQEKEFEEFLLKDVVRKVVSTFQILAADKSIKFNFYFDNSIEKIVGDPFTIEELFSNLLMNAVKYTPHGGHISLSVKNLQDHIITEVSDSGIGIPNEEFSKIFEEFYRASNVPKDIKTGSGLGLSIVKQIIENHKGRIWIASEVGAWTRVTFNLPRNPYLIG